MTIQAATPYIILLGKARRAIELYTKALGATSEGIQTFGDVDGSCPEARRDLVMHAALRVGTAQLFLSDGAHDGELPKAGIVHVALSFDDVAETRRCFDALAATGKVVQPLFEAPWRALFGAVDDEFGVGWMFNCAL